MLAECLSLHNVGLCCGRFHKMQVSGRAVPKRYDRARPLACFTSAAVRHQASLYRCAPGQMFPGRGNPLLAWSAWKAHDRNARDAVACPYIGSKRLLWHLVA